MVLYDEMRSQSSASKNIAYNTLPNAFAQCGAMHRLPQLLAAMKNYDLLAEPDFVTYSTIAKGYCAPGCMTRLV